MNIQTRISNLEEKIGVNQKPKSLKEMLDAFIRGAYGNIADLLSLTLAGHDVDPKTSGYPEEVIKYVQDLYTKNKRA